MTSRCSACGGVGSQAPSLSCGTFYDHGSLVNGTGSIAIVSGSGDAGVVIALNLWSGRDADLVPSPTGCSARTGRRETVGHISCCVNVTGYVTLAHVLGGVARDRWKSARLLHGATGRRAGHQPPSAGLAGGALLRRPTWVRSLPPCALADRGERRALRTPDARPVRHVQPRDGPQPAGAVGHHPERDPFHDSGVVALRPPSGRSTPPVTPPRRP